MVTMLKDECSTMVPGTPFNWHTLLETLLTNQKIQSPELGGKWSLVRFWDWLGLNLQVWARVRVDMLIMSIISIGNFGHK